MPNDPKWRTIARISGQPITTVLSIYVHLLVDASENVTNVTRGVTFITHEDLASALDVTEGVILSVINAMQGRVLEGNKLSGWDARQPKREDLGNRESGAKSAAERKRAQREREKTAIVTNVTKNVTCHEMSQNNHEMVTHERDILSLKSSEFNSQLIDKKDVSQMSRNITLDKEEIREDKETTTVLLAGEDEIFAAKNKPSGDDAQTQGMKWVEFFVNKIGFQIHEAQTAKTVPMFVQWEKLGVTVADVELAMIAAKRALNGSNPSNPVYYRRFVEQVMLEKQKSQEDQERTNSGLNSKNNGGTYVAKNGNHETRANSGKKLSLVEEGQLAIDRIEARELKKQAEHERIIN